jgi:hypothetical protein
MEETDMRKLKIHTLALGWTLALSVASSGLALAQDMPAKPAQLETKVPMSTTTNTVPKLAPAKTAAEQAQREAWREKMARTPRKSGACYKATYPDTTWHEVPCKPAPKHYFPPRPGVHTDTIGNGTTDYVAQPANSMSMAEGSFDSVSTTSVQTEDAGSGGVNGPNLFSLQLNSEYVNTKQCTAALGPKCRGWVQFVYDNSAQDAYVQYWLLNDDFTPFTAGCPGAWQPNSGYCVQTSPMSAQTFTSEATSADLQDMKVFGTVGTGVTVYWGGSMISAPDIGAVPDLASNWFDAEFNVFGDGGAGQAVFSGTTSITVRTQVDTGINVAPDCYFISYTGETNNLNLISTPAIEPKKQYPSIIFIQGSANTPASCSTSVGDPHITTFDGLYYSFYASGDFVLADAGPDFIVQGRQESGAKVFSNPNVSMNTAVAAQMGSNHIAIYDSPQRVVVNGKTTSVANNQIINLSDGVAVLRLGSLYVLTRSNGDLVRAQLNNGWMDITVGLGRRARSSTHGILASPTGSALSMRDGTVLKEPVSGDDLYQRYAKSWLVQPKESLFADKAIPFAAPAQLITAADLDKAAYAQARAACTAAGVTDATHLDSCTLDTAVFKSKVAIKAFTRAMPARLEIKPVAVSALKQP